MSMRLALPAGGGAITCLASEAPLEFQMFQILQFMTVSLRSMHIMLSPLNTLHLKHLKRGHVGNYRGGNGNVTGKGNGKGPMLKSLTCSIAALATKFEKLACLMMMMMNPQRRRKVPPIAQMLL
jgi:hypothetical protein